MEKRYNFRILEAKRKKEAFMKNKMFINVEMSDEVYSNFKQNYTLEKLTPEDIENGRRINLAMFTDEELKLL